MIAQNLVQNWLKSSSIDVSADGAFLGEEIFIDLFLEYNTAIPSSAAVERFFSTAKYILRVKSSSLSDENFEILLFIKDNMHLLRKINR